MGRPRSAVVAAVALVATAAPVTTAAGAPGATTRPPAVRSIAEFDNGRHVWVSWTNPRNGSFARVVVRLAKGRIAPADPSRGRAITLARPRATSARLPRLAAGTAYTVAVWTRDSAGRYSPRTKSTFSTQPRSRTGTIAGVVTDAHGDPLSGVGVFLETGGRTKTDAAGRYRLAAPVGEAYVDLDGSRAAGGTFDATGYRFAFVRTFVRAGVTRTVNRTLRGGGLITGRFVDETGQPLAGLNPELELILPFVESGFGGVFASFAFLSDGSGPKGTGADGRFALRGLAPGANLVCTEASVARTSANVDHDYAGRCAPLPASVAPGQHLSIGNLTLFRDLAGVLTGTVRDPRGRPVPNAGVEVSRGRADVPTFALTDANGVYRVPGLGSGQYHACVDPRGDPSARTLLQARRTCSVATTVQPGHVSTANIRMLPAGAVAGRLTTTSGAPIAGAYVALTSRTGRSEGFALTDGSGHFRAGALAPGRYQVCFQPPDGSARIPTGTVAACRGPRVPVRSGFTTLGVDARLRVGGAITGRVTDRRGRPLSDVDVEARLVGAADNTGDAVTGSDGRFTLVGLPAGTYRVCFQEFEGAGHTCFGSSRYATATNIPVRAGHTVRHVDAVLPAPSGGPGAIRVTARDNFGNPIAGVDAVALQPCTPEPDYPDECDHEPLFGNKPTFVAGSDVTGPGGSITLDELPPGHYVVCLFAYDGATTADRSPTGYTDACTGTAFSLAVTAGQTTQVTQVLQPGGAVTGRITDTQGHPVGGVPVLVAHSGASDYNSVGGDPLTGSFLAPSPREQAVTKPDGTYEVHGVTPGSQSVCVPARFDGKPTGYLAQCAASPAVVTSGVVAGGIDLTLTRSS